MVLLRISTSSTAAKNYCPRGITVTTEEYIIKLSAFSQVSLWMGDHSQYIETSPCLREHVYTSVSVVLRKCVSIVNDCWNPKNSYNSASTELQTGEVVGVTVRPISSPTRELNTRPLDRQSLSLTTRPTTQTYLTYRYQNR